MTQHEREVMQAALDVCRKDYLHAIESINLEIRLGACKIRASELTVKHDEIVQRIKQIDRACLAQPEPEPLWIRNSEGKLELHAAQKKEGRKPEPVAWAKDFESSQPRVVTELKYRMSCEVNEPWIPLYTAPPPAKEFVGLTDDDLDEIYNRQDWDVDVNYDYEHAIEAKLKDKNT